MLVSDQSTIAMGKLPSNNPSNSYPMRIGFYVFAAVHIHYGCRITDVDFKVSGEQRWIERLHLESAIGEAMEPVEVRRHDRAFMTIGSIVSNHSQTCFDRLSPGFGRISTNPCFSSPPGDGVWRQLISKCLIEECFLVWRARQS